MLLYSVSAKFLSSSLSWQAAVFLYVDEECDKLIFRLLAVTSHRGQLPKPSVEPRWWGGVPAVHRRPRVLRGTGRLLPVRAALSLGVPR